MLQLLISSLAFQVVYKLIICSAEYVYMYIIKLIFFPFLSLLKNCLSTFFFFFLLSNFLNFMIEKEKCQQNIVWTIKTVVKRSLIILSSLVTLTALTVLIECQWEECQQSSPQHCRLSKGQYNKLPKPAGISSIRFSLDLRLAVIFYNILF